MRNIKVAFAASSGGHLEQLFMLEPLIKKYDSFVITEKTKYSSSLNKEKCYYMLQVNRREFLTIPKMFINSVYSFYILIKEKPNVIICTGVLAMVPICILCKIFGGKLIYIESFAKVNNPSMTGKLLYKFADRFYIQWKELKKYYPNSIFLGGIY